MSGTDKEHVESCLNGRPDAFRQLVRRYEQPLTVHLIGRLGDSHAAEEAAQESLVRAYFLLRRLRKPDSFFPWLLGIADRVAMEAIRKRQKELRIAALAADAMSARSDESIDLEVVQALSELPAGLREVVLLRFYGDLSCKQVAERLDVPVGTVTKQLSRAYVILRDLLWKQGRRPRASEVQP